MTLQRLQRAARERVPEGVRLDSLPWRTRWLLHAAYPGNALRYFTVRWRHWATQPGDVWWDFLADRYFVVAAVKPRHVEAEMYSGQIWNRPDLMARAATAPRVRIGSPWDSEFRTGMTVEVAHVDRSDMDRWHPA